MNKRNTMHQIIEHDTMQGAKKPICDDPSCICGDKLEKRREKRRRNQPINELLKTKDSHDLAISAMSPSYCRRCNKSGSELGAKPCHKREKSHP